MVPGKGGLHVFQAVVISSRTLLWLRAQLLRCSAAFFLKDQI